MVPWNVLISAIEYMNASETDDFKGENFTIKRTKGKIVITVET